MKSIYLFILACLVAFSVDARVLTDRKGRKADLKILGWNGELVKVQNKEAQGQSLVASMKKMLP